MPVFKLSLDRAVTLCMVAGILLSSGCSLWRGAEEVAPPPPQSVDTPPTTLDLEAYPVRQPPLPPRDGDFAPLPSTVASFGGRDTIPLRADAPERYTVVRGDTLWDISGRFLRDPWYWPEIWDVNPQIENPHLIYPGDVLSLVWVDGQPRIRLQRGGQVSGNRLSPQIRVEPLAAAIPTIPYDALAAFISKPTIVTKAQLKEMPYIVDIKESHLVAGSGFTVYVRGVDTAPGARYNVFHIGEPYDDPQSGKRLGFEALFVGAGRVTESGDPAKMFLNETVREALRGDRLMLQEAEVPANFFPSAPEVAIDGRILSVVDGVSLIGQYQIVAINRGESDGLTPGHVLSIWQQGRVTRDRWARRGLFGLSTFGEKVTLPDERAGRMLVFRTLDTISYGLIVSATSEIKVKDIVRNPD